MNDYDCTLDVLKHKQEVQTNLTIIISRLLFKSLHHDDSKLLDPAEKEMFDRWTPELRQASFGTDEYKKALDNMGEGVQLHYKANRHHPEHFIHGIAGMDLMDLMEMVADWMAAAKRNGKKVDLEFAVKRFNLDPQLESIIRNTLDVLEE